jgi:hypothetical protein
MSEPKSQEARSWTQEEADGDRAIAELRRALERLRGQVGAYREHIVDDDTAADDQPGA